MIGAAGEACILCGIGAKHACTTALLAWMVMDSHAKAPCQSLQAFKQAVKLFHIVVDCVALIMPARRHECDTGLVVVHRIHMSIDTYRLHSAYYALLLQEKHTDISYK